MRWLWHRIKSAWRGVCYRCGHELVGVFDTTWCPACEEEPT